MTQLNFYELYNFFYKNISSTQFDYLRNDKKATANLRLPKNWVQCLNEVL